MIRRLGLLLLVTALIVSACGRQVTPNRPGTGPSGLQSGYMSVKFRVAAPFNFSTYQYVVMFNTTGDGHTPLPLGQQTNFQGYSFALVVSGSGGAASVQAIQYARPATPTQAPARIIIPTTPQQLQLTMNSNGSNTEFTIIFARVIASGVFTPAPSATPSQTASPSPTPSPSPSPTPTASGAPSPTPVPSPTAPPPYATSWLFNYFITDLNNVPVDSLGQGGPADTSYGSPVLDTTQAFDIPVTVLLGNHPGDQGADNITGGEIANAP